MIRKIFSLFVVFLIGCGGSSSSPGPHITKSKGEFATASIYENHRLKWASNFKIVEIGELEITQDQIDFLRKKGVEKIFVYQWMPAGYHYISGDDDPFMDWVYQNRYTLTLNPEGPFPHCNEMGYTWCQDYYYDFGNQELVERRVSFIKEKTLDRGIDGVFFDWASGVFIEEEVYRPIKDRFYQLHPDGDYFKYVSDFYDALRKEGVMVFTNQGFRKASYHLPVVDYDMTESYITTDEVLNEKAWIILKDEAGKTVKKLMDIPITNYYPVSVDVPSLEDTAYYMNYLETLKNQYSGKNFKRFVYMNYVSPELEKVGEMEGYPVFKAKIPKNAIFFSYAMGKLCGEFVYTEVPLDHSLEKEDLYFYRLGNPLGDTFEKIGNQKYIRFFSNGFVIAGLWENPQNLTVSSPYLKNGFVYDIYNRKWLKIDKNSIEIKIEPYFDHIQQKIVPIGRVFVYSD
jgi:hypothetical protein